MMRPAPGRTSGRRGLLSLAALALAGSAAAAPCDAPAPVRFSVAPERVLSISTPAGRIAATWAAPADAAPEAVVLMLHGYTGSRNEFPAATGEGMFARTARAFAERGIASLRIDFIGSGESDGEWRDTTPAGQARDARAALAFLSGHEAPAGVPLGILGYSMGGLAALRAAQGAEAARVALWNPVMEPERTFSDILGKAAFDAARTAGEDDTVAGTRLRPAFFAGLSGADPMADARALRLPLLFAVGQNDIVVRDGPSLARRAASLRAAPTEVIAVRAGHDLGAKGDLPLFDGIAACTAAFLLRG
jgi:hypothetical protein